MNFIERDHLRLASVHTGLIGYRDVGVISLSRDLR